MRTPAIVAAVDDAERGALATRMARQRVDAAREIHDRLLREVQALELRPERNAVPLECFRAELARARTALRAASRELVRSIA